MNNATAMRACLRSFLARSFDCHPQLSASMVQRVNPSEEFQPLIDQLFVEKVMRARAISPERRMMMGLELFEIGVGLMRDGVRAQHPDFTLEQVAAEVSRRFARIREIEEEGIYLRIPPLPPL